ncbi:MAG: tetratricopeptide repeat protein [Armatimonadetes bacterium]|nr:tetratricopeptide repeat protein [Armatimonadota bacterium]
MGVWRVTMLGRLALHRHGRSEPVYPTRMLARLLARLAYPGRTQAPRVELVDELYPDLSEEEGRTALRQVILRLRRLLEPVGVEAGSVLECGRQHVGLNSALCGTDVAEFDAAMDAATGLVGSAAVEALERAVSLYGGDLLPGMDAEWAAPERQRLRARALDAILRLAAHCESGGDDAGAADYALRAVAADAYCQPAHLVFIRSAAAMGDAAAARRRLAAMEKLWRDEFGSDVPAEAHAAAAGTPRAATRMPRHGLVPVPVSRFFGREAEIAEIRRLLTPAPQRARLLTLTGPGGSGKTRLATEAAMALMDAYEGAIRFVPLADVSGPGSVAPAVARALGVPDSSDEALAGAIGNFERPSEGCLLVLDNLEHVAAEGAMLVEKLLSHCPRLAVLATSRRSLGVQGERNLPVAPLETPPEPAPPERMAGYPSVEMLVDRIQARRPGFALTDRNAHALAELCTWLDGLPLAIELVSAWAATYTPEEILARVDSVPALLSNPSSTAAPRVASLQAAMEWSLHLLDARLRRFFAELSVFRGGWTLQAAEAICGGGNAVTLRNLQECSLVTAGEVGGRMRFGMLETLRAFAARRLRRADADRVRGKHARWFAGMAQREVAQATDHSGHGWDTTLEPDLANCRAALHWCLLEPGRSAADIDSGVRLAAALWPYWFSVGRFDEGRTWLTAARAAGAGQRTAAYARLLQGLGLNASVGRPGPEAVEWASESLAIYRELGDAVGEAQALGSLGIVHQRRQEHAEARRCLEQALAAAQAIGHDEIALSVLAGLALAAEADGQPDQSTDFRRRALGLATKLGSKRYAALLLQDGGFYEWRVGDLHAARSSFEQSQTLFRELGDTYREVRCLWGLGLTALRAGDAPRARGIYHTMLDMVRCTGHRVLRAPCLEGVAHLAELHGKHACAATLLAHADMLREAPDMPAPWPAVTEDNAALSDRLQSALGEEAFRVAYGRGRAISSDEALQLASERGLGASVGPG